jgi:hypothetical protein
MNINVNDIFEKKGKFFRVFRILPMFVITYVKLLETKKEYSVVISKIDLQNNYKKV